MKKTMTMFGAIMIIALLFTSCSTVQVAKFTSVENIYRLKLGSSLESVVDVLGFKPYNILGNQVDGYAIYTYKYKLVERKVNPNFTNDKGEETTGREVYNGKEQTLFLFFKSDKLEAFVTTEGRKDSPSLIMFNNTIYAITMDKDKYIFSPSTSLESKENISPFNKKKKEKKN
jgi:hypothetical protein